MDLSTASQYGQNFRVGKSSSPSGGPTLSTCRNCRLGRHLSRARNLVVFSVSSNIKVLVVSQSLITGQYLVGHESCKLDMKVC